MRLAAAPLLLALSAPALLAAQAADERVPDRWSADQALVVGQVAGTWTLGVATMGGKGSAR